MRIINEKHKKLFLSFFRRILHTKALNYSLKLFFEKIILREYHHLKGVILPEIVEN